jgi:hypothetical protein
MKSLAITLGKSLFWRGFHFNKEKFKGCEEIHNGREYWIITVDLGYFWINIDDNQWLLTEAGLG